MTLQVLYEDNHLIAVYKPAGVLVQGDATGDATLMDEVKYYLKTKYHKLGKVYLGLVHRLDRPVQGIILFAKTSKGAARLSEQFRNHSVEKIYHALVIGKPKKQQDTLVHFLQKEEKNNKVIISETEKKDFLLAELSYEIVKSNGQYSLLKIKLGTGRPHQIRAQLAAIGYPIVGDVKYGPNLRSASFGGQGAPHLLPDHSIALAATSLTFKTATGEEEKTVAIEVPEVWGKYL